MARLGIIYLTVICLGLLTPGLYAQTPDGTPPPHPPDPGMDHPDRPFPDKNGDGPGRKDKEPGMGRKDGPFGSFMGGPQFEKMVELALASEADFQQALQKWPHIQDKEPEAQERFLKQIENFRKFLKNQALKEAGEIGLQIKPDQEDEFVHNFWKKKLEVERTLRKEMEPRKRELTDKMNEDLKKQYGS